MVLHLTTVIFGVSKKKKKKNQNKKTKKKEEKKDLVPLARKQTYLTSLLLPPVSYSLSR